MPQTAKSTFPSPLGALSDVTASFASGALFGSALLISRVYDPSVVIEQLQLCNFRMLSVFLTAAGSSAVVQYLFNRWGLAQPSIRGDSTLNWFGKYDGNLIGGAMVGVGMALAGACPGTVLIQLGIGDGLSRYTILGAIMGGMAFSKYSKKLFMSTKRPQSARKETFGDVIEADVGAVLVAFEILCITVISLASWSNPKLDREAGWSHPVLGGLLIGLTQAFSILLTSTTLGVSTAYEQLGRYALYCLRNKDIDVPAWPPRSLIFALGILVGGAALDKFNPWSGTIEYMDITVWRAMLGGFCLSFGARTAGGCTSGHGVSGLSAFSVSSFLTVGMMFLAGTTMGLLLK